MLTLNMRRALPPTSTASRTARRSVEDEVLELVATAIPEDDEVPADLLEALAPLPSLSDAALWRVARKFRV